MDQPHRMTLDARIALRRGALDLDLKLAVQPGQTLVLLGPNGAGKSTALRVLAGLLRPAEGLVVLGEQILDDPVAGQHVPPHKRAIGMVFQDYLLFPHLSVVDNVAFGLRSHGVARSTARGRALACLERVGLVEHARSRPSALSGGQAQRAALARALAVDPELLLLDEPLAALDARTRLEIRSELRRHLSDFAGPSIVVSHDPIDAMALGDQVAVIEDGHVAQAGPPGEIARRPRTDYVARLVGLTLLAGKGDGAAVRLASGARVAVAEPVSGAVFAAIRPEHVSLYTAEPRGSPRNVWECKLVSATPYGNAVRCDLDGPVPLTADITAAAFAELGLGPGSTAWASVKAQEIEVYAI